MEPQWLLSVLQRLYGNAMTFVEFPGPTRILQFPRGKELQQRVIWHDTLMLDPYYFLVLQGTRSPIAWPTHSPPLRGSYNSCFRHVGWYFLDRVLSLQEQLLEATLAI